jgi:maltose O-acetyltransferase
MDQPITGFHTDSEGDWVAELACGHFQHTRHNPPWTNRPWVVTPEGRASVLGQTLACRKCDQKAPPDSLLAAAPSATTAPATERQKMLSGALYDANDSELVAARAETRALLRVLNALDPHSDAASYRATLTKLLGTQSDVFITPPFQCDYGRHLRLGASVYFSFNCVVLDVAEVTIGDHVLIGPDVQIYTATHPMDATVRRTGFESARPITIGDDAWIGGASVICPGITVGARSVIGAGSVVTRDVPADVFAAGNPCRVVRSLG